MVADRAGHQCSFPTCSNRTISAENSSSGSSSDGVAAHIYSASPGGARGQGGLTCEELSSQENCIWLCASHARLVDNNKGSSFPPETLVSYKDLQEARVIREHQGLFSPFGWIHKFRVETNPLFARGQTIRLSKLNLFYGENATGKSALTEWILGAFEPEMFRRWQHPQVNIDVRVTFLNPQVHSIKTQVKSIGRYTFQINRDQVPFVPVGIRIFRLSRLYHADDEDDLSLLARYLRLPPGSIHGLIEEIHNFPYAKIRNLRFQNVCEQSMLYLDLDGTVPDLPFRMLSGREQERVLIEFATAAARGSCLRSIRTNCACA